MLEELLMKHYGFTAVAMQKAAIGAGSDTYFAECLNGKFVLKFPCSSAMNHPLLEPDLCEYLLEKGLKVSDFVRNRDGNFVSTDASGRQFHLQRFVEGKTFAWNTAPEWLLRESAQTLGKIHTALKDYTGLPTGIGAGFFRHMTPETALVSYQRSLKIAQDRQDDRIADDLIYRIEQMEHFPKYKFDLKKLTCQATHGDYFISQLICGKKSINAVIDWTTACVHPVVWELVRSYVYAAPECANGEIDVDAFSDYVSCYLEYAPLNRYDLQMMAKLFYYQITVGDYYGQYYGSEAENKEIYLAQAVLSTKLMRWFVQNIEALTEQVCANTAQRMT